MSKMYSFCIIKYRKKIRYIFSRMRINCLYIQIDFNTTFAYSMIALFVASSACIQTTWDDENCTDRKSN